MTIGRGVWAQVKRPVAMQVRRPTRMIRLPDASPAADDRTERPAPAPGGRPHPSEPRRVAYVVSRFPKLSETFVLTEILAVEREGVRVELYPLLRARNTGTYADAASIPRKVLERLRTERAPVVMHPEAAPLVERAHYYPMVSPSIAAANLAMLARRPRAYLSALWAVVRATWGNLNYFLAGVGQFPKVVCMARSMASEGVSHVHAHFANHPAAAAFVVHRLTGIPYSFTAHGADLHVAQHMLAEKVAEASFVVAISDYNREFIVRHCGEEARPKITVIRCGVDLSMFQPSQRDDGGAGVPWRPFTFVAIGTLSEVKGHTYLVEACRLLRERGVDFVCRLVGDGPLRAGLVAQAEAAELDGHLLFEGQLRRSDVARVLKEADALVLPSVPTDSGRREGIPVVVMEAMACSLPVVASALSGIPEVVTDRVSGFLLSPRDPSAIATALEILARDPALRRRFGQAGRATAEAALDLRRSALALIRRYEEQRP